jgi:hypothetical protein
MSFQKEDRTFQSKKGKSFHVPDAYVGLSFAQVVAAAMRSEWGATPSARKEVGRIARANERAVRNWFEGRNGPSGENLVSLIRHSDAVLESVLMLSGRHELVHAAGLFSLRDQLKQLVDAIDELRAQ